MNVVYGQCGTKNSSEGLFPRPISGHMLLLVDHILPVCVFDIMCYRARASLTPMGTSPRLGLASYKRSPFASILVPGA